MQRGRNRNLAKIAVVLPVVPILIYAYVSGPDPGKSGVPNESLCSEAGCHVGTPNSGPGKVGVAFPNGLAYTPGVKQHLVVTVSDPNQRRWGFQLTARKADDPKTQAGTFTPASDGFTQVVCASVNLISQGPPCNPALPLLYIEHTQAGTRLGTTQSGSFEFDWTPPATDIGDIVVYVAGNAANGDGNNTGDRIYTARYTLSVASATGDLPPQIDADNGVVNGASLLPGIQAGSWITIKGSHLAATTRTWRTDEIVDGKLPIRLDDVAVNVNGQSAFVYFISPNQINAQAPSDTALGPVSVEVVRNGVHSNAVTAQLQEFSPAFFLWNGKYAVATRTDFSLAARLGLFPGLPTVPAKPGDIIILWGTGFGATDPSIPAGQTVDRATSVITNPVIRVGGITAEFLGGALSPGSAGLYQIVIRIPDTVPDGDQKIEAECGNFRSPDNVFLTIER